MKTIFITGGNSGIGKETTKYFANKGWRVIATMRNLSKAGELAEMENVVIMPLELMNPEQIKETCKKAMEEYDVDVLFNNAGYGVMGALERIPEEVIRDLFEADVIGTMLVTQQFIPHFKARKAGSILTTTSLAGIIALPRDGAYGAAKRAQQGMVESLYYELKPFGVSVKAMIPGGTNTNFQTPFNDLTGYEEPSAKQREYLLAGNEIFPGPEEAAEVVWTAVTDGEDRINYPTDSVCQKLYDEYMSMNKEEFKTFFYGKVFGAINRMIRHIFTTGLVKEASEEQLDDIVKALKALDGKIPGTKNFIAQKNLGWYQNKARLVVSADFESRKDLELYMTFPEHLKVGDRYGHLFDEATGTIVQIEL